MKRTNTVSIFRRLAKSEAAMIAATMPTVAGTSDPLPTFHGEERVAVVVRNVGTSRLVRVAPRLTATIAEAIAAK